MATNWTPDSWRNAQGIHMPEYPDAAALAATEETLRNYPPLVFAGEARNLTADLAKVVEGKSIPAPGRRLRRSFAESIRTISAIPSGVLSEMAVVLTFAGKVPVVKLGRMAGQFAKPRSAPTETIGGVPRSRRRWSACSVP